MAFSPQLLACSCGSYPAFCENAIDYNLFVGRVISQQTAYYPGGGEAAYFTNLEVINHMNSTTLPDTVSMVNQDGLNCNASIFGLLAGDSIVISIIDLSYIVEYNPDYTNIPTHVKYDLAGCGTYFLKVDQGKVGGVTPTQEIVSLNDFIQNPYENCPIVTTTINPLQEKVLLYPNPVQENLFIQNDAGSQLNCTLLNSQGVALKQLIITANGTEQLPLSDLPTGIYLLKMNDGIHERHEFIVRQ